MKKGFTLIELLAVIVILSIIALIATPMIMNVIEDSRIKSYRRSAEGYLKSAENFYVLSETDLGKQDKIGKNIINELKVKGIEAKGEIYVYYNGEIDFALLIGDKCFTKRKDQSITEIEMSDEIDNCNIDFAYNKETTPKVEDENPGIICGTNEEDYTNANECHIKSAEDLIAFSTLVKSGKNFDKKTVYLDNSINLSKNISYVDSLNTTFGDINGDGKVEPLITELANSYPLSSTFKGTFEGNNNYIAGINLTTSQAKAGFIGNNDGTIKNLTIKDSNITGGNYTGVIGYSGGTIYNLSVLNCNITGGDYTGIIGYGNNVEKVYFKNNKVIGNNSVGSIGQGQTVKNVITVDNEITGVNRVGGIAGYANKLTTAIVSNKVTSTGTIVGGAVGGSTSTSSVISSSIVTGVKEVAGLVGSGGYRNSITGLITGGTVTGTNDVDFIEGYKNGGYDAYMSDTYKIYLNETEKVISETDALYAKVIDHEKMNNINIYNLIVDTWINGDDDGDGYYFDYENGTDNIVIKDVSTMISTLTGSGTEEDPYIINNVDDMKSATLYSNQTKYFKLNSDIDFSNQHFYSFASFNGVFDGNNHTLSNINTVYGVFTGNSGTIKNLIIDKANVYGKNSVGIITNTNSGSISNVEVKNSKIEGNERVGIIGEVSNSSSVIDKLIVHDNTITGKKYVGSVFGMHNNYGTSTYLISTNNNISGETSVGGITGYNGSGTINFAISSNNITCTVTDCGGIAGGASNGTAKNLISSSNINGSKSVGGLVGDTRTGSSTSGIVIGGTLSGTSSVGKLVGYQYSGGVSGLAYESVKRIINGVEDTTEDTSTIQEDFINEINTYDIAVDTWINGTTNNYYFDYDSLTKVVSIKPSTTIASTLTGSGTEEDPYIINNVSDMKSATLYSNQTKYFKLNSDIDFSNQTYYVFGDFNGVFDGNNHTLSNIKLNTAYAGLFRNNKGTIKNLKINKAIVTGSSKNIYSGIITSTNSGTIENIEITNSSLTGLGSKGGIGLIAGNNTGTITNVVTNNNVVKGVDNVGGIAGLNNKTITTAVSNNTITCTGTNCGGIMGQVYNGCSATDLISSSNIIGNKSVGGLVGDTRYGSYTAGKVTNCTIRGNQTVGISVGYKYSGSVSGTYTSTVTKIGTGGVDGTLVEE